MEKNHRQRLIEEGLIEPGVLTVKKMAQALGCSMDDLV